MRYLPLGFDLASERRECLLVGGGAKAASKAGILLKAQARLLVICPDIDASLRDMVNAAGGRCEERECVLDDARDKALIVIAAEELSEPHLRLARCARQSGIAVNVVDQPRESNVVFPAIVDRSPLSFAIHSDGEAPYLSGYWRSRLEGWIPAAWGRLATLCAELKADLRKVVDANRRRRFWERLLESPAASLSLAGRTVEARAAARQLLESEADVGGEVWLVGAGPGDADLLTLRALQLMQRADVVFYDRLVSEAVLERLRRDVERVAVGKAPDCHPVPQSEINRLMIERAESGHRVLRLKGGDPFVFGRGGEEIGELMEMGIPFEVVPGISAANGCACYAGIPLTHRDFASSVRFLSGHPRDGELSLPWERLIEAEQTLVFYMSSQGLAIIGEKLIEHGLASSTPAALIERGTMPDARLEVCDLASLARRRSLRPPVLLIVGEVVALHKKLKWRGENA